MFSSSLNQIVPIDLQIYRKYSQGIKFKERKKETSANWKQAPIGEPGKGSIEPGKGNILWKTFFIFFCGQFIAYNVERMTFRNST